ncbi:DnaT-like ssDNA-binding domain-containing protein [Buchnera aphidicola]|uniref:DnaT-like ssDNA-binding domain-containing protein n=1 Tax=Buchnera aphidicola TaxID=9 RepID=UPI003463F25A
MKISISKSINIDLFCKNPIKILEKKEHDLFAVLKKNTPVFYVITPDFFKEFFDIKYYLNNDNPQEEKKKYIQKFSMHTKWKPDQDFLHQSALWGINLIGQVSKCELACFISYWKAEGCFFHHIQWQQKLARSLQKSRSLHYEKKNIRNITDIPIPDKKTPNGFRGE